MDDELAAPARRRRGVAALLAARSGLSIVVAVFTVVAVITVAVVVSRPVEHSTARHAPIIVQGWAPYWQTDSVGASLTAHAATIDEVSLFAYHTTDATTVVAYDAIDPGALDDVRQVAASRDVAVTASIVDDTGAGAMAAILADPSARAGHVAAILKLAIDTDVEGIDLDYETFAFVDGRSTWEATRPHWVRFVHELADALHGAGKTLTVSVPPTYDPNRTGGDRGYWVYDPAAIADAVDVLRIMAYDYHTADPGPIAPVDWVRGLVADMQAVVPRDKLVLGVPVYGYNWPTAVVGQCPADQQPRRQNQSTRSAQALAAELGIVPTYDAASAESTFSYDQQVTGTDAGGAAVACTVSRTVWFADAGAVFVRSRLARNAGLAGVALWSLGSEDDAVWSALAAVRSGATTWPPTTAG